MYNEVRVFVENKSGKLARVAGILGDAGVDILNLELVDDGQFGAFKILAADPEAAKNALSAAGMSAAYNQVAIIEIPDRPGGLVTLAIALEAAGINLNDAYGCILERGKRALFVVKGENLDLIQSTANKAGLKVLDSLE